MTTFSIVVNFDNQHEGPQWWAEVLEITAEGTDAESVETIHATTWYADDMEAERVARNWLWEHKRNTSRHIVVNHSR